jgi:glycosyltransferase involved in cell wall biosynthesis
VNVSVIIATHGSEKWHEAAWSFAYPSAKAQGEVEIIVNHLNDGTLAESRNDAAEDATGDWLVFLDADDQLGDGYVEAIRAGGSRDWIYPTALLVPAIQYVENGRCVGPCEIPSWGRPLIEINCAVIGTAVPRELFLGIGGFRELEMYEDWDLWLRCVLAGATLVPVPDATYCAARSAGRNSKSDAIETYWKIRREHELAFARLAP